MKVLLIDTCGETGSLALAETGGPRGVVVASLTLPARKASERLVASIRELATGAQIPLDQLGAVVVVHGPGSFTGVRVGVSTAKGLCEALGIPAIAISRLAVLAQSAPSGSRVAAFLDAGRGEFYCGVYQDSDPLRESLLTRTHALAAAEGSSVVVCEPAVAAALADLHPALVAEPTAEAALPIAILRIAAGQFDEVATLDANYLRRTDAEIFAKPQARASV